MFRKICILGFLTFVFAVGIFLAILQITLSDLPDLEKIATYNPPLVTKAYDADGNLFAEFFEERRTVIPISQIPKFVKDAFIAAEDSEFYHHKGLDYFGLLRAVLHEIKYYTTGGQRMGGSTITQQTTRALLLNSKRTYTRKLKEIILTRRIEERFSKEEILGLYLNQIYFGQGVYGIEEASRKYYGVSTADLSIGQAAALAGIPQSPNRLNPISNPERLRGRRSYVLGQMRTLGLINQSQFEEASHESVQAVRQTKTILGSAPHYAEEVRRILVAKFGEDLVLRGGLKVHTALKVDLQKQAQSSLRKGLQSYDKRHGYRGPFLRTEQPQQKTFSSNLQSAAKILFTDKAARGLVWDLSILTGEHIKATADELASLIDLKQPQSGIIVGARVAKIDPKEGLTVDLGSTSAHLSWPSLAWVKKPHEAFIPGDIVLVELTMSNGKIVAQLQQIPEVQGSFAAIDPRNHHVVAMVGSYDFFTSSYNRVTQAHRQAGSAIKPLLYSLAMDKQLITPATLITDAPRVYFEASNENVWKPRNVTHKYLGDITVRSCLVKSVNTCSIAILELLGIEPFVSFAENLKLSSKGYPLPKDLTIALGSADVTPLSLINAYTIFPNLGWFSEPIIITKVESSDGTLLMESTSNETQLLRSETAFVMTNVMKGFFNQPAARDKISLPNPLAGKTGTNNDARSLWFIGFSQDLVAGAHIAYDNNLSLGQSEFGISAAFPIWADFMNNALVDMPITQFNEPPGVEWKMIDQRTGLIAQATTAEPGEGKPTAIWEAFIAGTAPKESENKKPLVPFELFEAGGVSP